MTLNKSELIHIRRHLHEIPELALHEKETTAYLEKVVRRMPTRYLTIHRFAPVPTALFVRVQGSDPKRTIGYRADMDALPVTEQTGLPFASKHPGVMHACGHDIHMTVALGILSYFATNQPKDNLVFFFQPAEEADSGGKLVYDKGGFSGKFKPDEFYALHDNPNLPAGTIGCRKGTLTAGTNEVNVDLIGKSGHAAYPQKANDMVVAAAQYLSQVQAVISRSISPLKSGVITFGKVRAGVIRNVIAGHARLEGTIRGLTQGMIQRIDNHLKMIGDGIAASFGCQVETQFNQGGYWPVTNNNKLTHFFIHYMKHCSKVNFVYTQPVMTGEDMGYLLHKFPGTMFWLGVQDSSQLHSSTFNPKESAIPIGVNEITDFLKARMQK
ncbi:N-acetyldiaminopimelate deacetylase [uncultured bacterium]|nr:N-acetyldiaminopimelate deacetylase [uncultured bacterium]